MTGKRTIDEGITKNLFKVNSESHPLKILKFTLIACVGSCGRKD